MTLGNMRARVSLSTGALMSRSIPHGAPPRRDGVPQLAIHSSISRLPLESAASSVMNAPLCDACVLVTVPPFTFRVLREHDLDVTTSIFRVNRMFTLELPDCRGVR